MVVEDSLLKGTEDPVCPADPPHSEVWCLPGAWVTDITRKLPRLAQPSDYYPLLLFHVGGDEAGRKLMGKNQTPRQQRESCGWCLLQAA